MTNPLLRTLPLFFSALLSLPAVSEAGHPDSLCLTNAGKSAYRIVIPRNASDVEIEAASKLQKYLEEISGAQLPVRKERRWTRKHEILVGRTRQMKQIEPDIHLPDLEEDGFAIVTAGDKLIITGGKDKGTLYGVYSFLEKYLDCRFYSSTVRIIPEKPSLFIGEINDKQVPVIQFREDYYRDVYHPEFLNWHKLDNHREEWGEWVHTFHRLVPPEKYFENHPEYFALRNGKRHPSQLCLSDTNVFNIVVTTLEKWIEENPEAHYWSVSQNDNQNYCECEQCKAMNEREGSPSGSIIAFVNKVAGKFPDKTISTLAYQYSRSAPKNLKPAENVNIMLCTIECNRSIPIQDDPASAAFRTDITNWSRITDNIIVWDYVIQFQNLLSPFPNLNVLQPNIQFFIRNNTSAMFQQGNREVGGEFAELRAYLIAKLLWDPWMDVDSLIGDFLNGYYGEAGPHLKEYIDVVHSALLESGKNLEIFGGPIDHKDGYLADSLVEIYNRLFDQAELSVEDKPEILERVKIARLPLDYAILEIARAKGTGEGGIFIRKEGQWLAREELVRKLDYFVFLSKQAGVTRIKEWHTTPDEYGESMKQLFDNGMKEHKALFKKIYTSIPPGVKYSGGKPETLTDGMRGTTDWNYFWLGWEGEDMDVTIDLGEPDTIRKVSAGFLQDNRSWIFMPEKVTIRFSLDGERFSDAIGIVTDVSADDMNLTIKPFEIETGEISARYIRIHALNRKVCPENHPAAGGKAWIFADEIVVE